MKHNLILFFTLISIFSFSQKYSFSASISNNGQVIHLEKFYYAFSGLTPSHESKFKIDLYGEIKARERTYFFIKAAFGKKLFEFSDANQDHTASQVFNELAAGLSYKVSIEKLSISSGFSVPVFFYF